MLRSDWLPSSQATLTTGILLDFSWDIMSQEKLQTIIMQNCGATTEVYYGIVQVEMMMMNDDETFI